MVRIKFIQSIFLFFIAISVFIYWCLCHLADDLWYDESYTLVNFVLVSWGNTLANYPLPNNHIFHNLLLQFFTRIFSFRSINEIAQNIIILRLFHTLFTIFIIVYLKKFTKLFSFKCDSNLVLVLLFTTIPFLNFSLQIRGYNLSALLLLMIVYYTLYYIQKGKKGLWIPFLAAFILYTIPSNLYFLVAVGMGLIVIYFWAIKDKNDLLKKRVLKLVFYYVIGVVLSVLVYFPVIENVFFNDFSSKESPYWWYVINLFWEFLISFNSSRFFLLLLIIPGVIYFFKQSIKSDKLIFYFLLIVFLGSFLIAILHQKEPFDRTFVPIIPIVVLLLGVIINSLIQKISNERHRFYALFLFFTLCIVTFLFENKRNNEFIRTQFLNNEIVLQTIYSNYFLIKEHNISDNLKFIKQHYNCPIVEFKTIDYPSIYSYKILEGIDTQSVATVEEIEELMKKESKIIIITSYLNSTIEKLEKIKGCRISFPNKNKGVISIIELIKQ